MKLGGFPERTDRKSWPRLLFLAAAWPLLATIVRPGPPLPPPGPGTATIRVSPVPLDPADPGRAAVGRLRFLGGWRLASDDPRFGGISGLHVEGGTVLAISDIGLVTRFALPARAGRLPVRFDPLVAGPGPRSRKSNRDSEALMVLGDRIWVSFERSNMIWRYDRATLAARGSARPAPMRRLGGNSGVEALVRLADGRVLALVEGRDDGRTLGEAVLFAGDPAEAGTPARRLRHRRPAGYRATDAALLPDGGLLILFRRFTWYGGFSARLALARVGRGGVIESEEIAALAPPLTSDNMEALSVTSEGGRNIVWIASDDNFSPLQRTLLLKFELMEARRNG
jgi:hypothetical protein